MGLNMHDLRCYSLIYGIAEGLSNALLGSALTDLADLRV